MNILAFDTATPVTSVAVASDGITLSEISITGDKAQMERLMPMVDAALGEAGIKIGDISGIAVGTGPGLFTSLRIGVVTANTLSQVLRVPVAGVSSLDALARGVDGSEGVIAAVIDARRGEVFAAIYASRDHVHEITVPTRVIKPDRLAAELAESGESLTIVGDGYAAYRDLFRDVLAGRASPASPECMFPRASSIAALARDELATADAGSPGLVAPVYIRQPDADKLIKKMKK
ncbi:MAG: tRNA (adenosine(37)-N6)-threonylcarbamoyltransferase complex dimerization subunit type 1 TsaB [Actinomycetota bacterium]